MKKNKTDLSKTWEAIRSIVKVGRISPMTYVNDKILKSFFFYPATPHEIVKIIKSFSNSKSAGPNSLPTPILKNCADVLSFPISYLVNLSFTTGEFPNLCNIAKVIPLFTKDDPLACSNYRPISLLSSKTKKELDEITIKTNKSKLFQVPNVNYLGVVLDEFLSWDAHVKNFVKS